MKFLVGCWHAFETCEVQIKCSNDAFTSIKTIPVVLSVTIFWGRLR